MKDSVISVALYSLSAQMKTLNKGKYVLKVSVFIN